MKTSFIYQARTRTLDRCRTAARTRGLRLQLAMKFHRVAESVCFSPLARTKRSRVPLRQAESALTPSGKTSGLSVFVSRRFRRVRVRCEPVTFRDRTGSSAMAISLARIVSGVMLLPALAFTQTQWLPDGSAPERRAVIEAIASRLETSYVLAD